MNGPLSGVRILDLTAALAGPWCTQILGAMGAEVIKLEPAGGEETRYQGPPFWDGESPLFLAANNNKRSVAVELGTPEGQELALKLAAECDVFLQNLKTGAAEKLGLGFESVRAVNPSIIYCSISGYGAVGPLADRPAYDLLMQAAGGVMSTTGEPDGRPLRSGPPLVDLSTGLWATIAILGALVEGSSEAVRLDTSLYESAVNLLPIQFAQYGASGEVAERLGASGNILVPFETLPTLDSDIVLAAGTNRLFRRLVETLGAPELADDERFIDNAARVRNRLELARLMTERLSTRTTSEWVELLANARVPAGAVEDIGEISHNPQFEALDMMPRVPHDSVTDLRVLAPPISRNGRRLPFEHGAPRLGDATEEMLTRVGYSGEQIARLAADGVITVAEPR